MTLPINEMGGLLAAEVDLRIDQAAKTQVTTLETKLKEHQEMIERRLTVTDQAVKDNLDRTNDLKTAVALLTDSNKRQTVLLESIDKNGQEWHAADLVFRSDVITRVSAIEIEQRRLTDQVKVIRWLVATSSGVIQALAWGLQLVCSESFWKIAGIGAVLYILQLVCPPLYHLAAQIIAK